MINASINVGIKGEYKAVVLRDGQVHHETDWFDNLILNSGLDYLGSDSLGVANAYCRVGTGTTPAAVNQTNLIAQVASKLYTDTDLTNLGVSQDYASLITYQYIFDQGALSTTITEVGVGWDASGSSLFSRALFSNSITVTSIDQLIIYYRFRIEPPLSDINGSLIIDGTSYNFTSRVAEVATFGLSINLLVPSSFSRITDCITYGDTAELGPVTGNLSASSTGDGADSYTYQTYVSESLTRTTTASYLPSSSNIPGGIKGFRVFGLYFKWQMLLNNPIMKDNLNLFTLTFRVGWSRI